MTVCNQNRVHCGLLKNYIDEPTKLISFINQHSIKEQIDTTEEEQLLAYLQGLYHLNGCDQSSIGADEIKHLVENGELSCLILIHHLFLQDQRCFLR